MAWLGLAGLGWAWFCFVRAEVRVSASTFQTRGSGSRLCTHYPVALSTTCLLCTLRPSQVQLACSLFSSGSPVIVMPKGTSPLTSCPSSTNSM
ncbi:hypothetical protein F4777DRAFT_565789 [Nemania sp. FL0916]|nr:hypothetical protein F4777DRAFT_565789 [Nemania sp. FL0916]